MPTSEEVLGFTNRWYLPAIESATSVRLEEDLEVRVVTAPLFLATKVEAFLNRGKEDYLSSPDLEDVIAILDGRPEVTEEVGDSSIELKTFLGNSFREFLNKRSFLDFLPGHLPSDQASQNRLPTVMDRIRTIAAMVP